MRAQNKTAHKKLRERHDRACFPFPNFLRPRHTSFTQFSRVLSVASRLDPAQPVECYVTDAKNIPFWGASSISIINQALMYPLLGHKPSLWNTHKENGP
jgi:hypothetical protein